MQLHKLNETPYEIFQRSPEEALEAEFQRSLVSWAPDAIFVWQGLMGIDGKTSYGMARYIRRDELARRKYRIEFWDGRVSIFWTDARHDPKTRQNIPVEDA